MNARPDRKATLWPGLLEKLVGEVRAEFRVQVYVPAADHPVWAAAHARWQAAIGHRAGTGCAQLIRGAGWIVDDQ